MGVYHFAGLGKSIGAITSALSYLGAIRQQGGEKAEAFFSLSDEQDHADESRGMVQALVLFTTEEIARDHRSFFCEPYQDNRAGSDRDGRKKGENLTVKTALYRVLGKELKGWGMIMPDKTTLDVYWCEHERQRPLETFERTYTVLQAAKAMGEVGKECWINLTGGSNVINGALQLATSFLGTAARQYYVLSKNPSCIRHTVPIPDLGSEQDDFWVNLPIVYTDFSSLHRTVLEELASWPNDSEHITHQRLHGQLCQYAEFYSLAGLKKEGDEIFRRTILQPLRSQRLIEHFPSKQDKSLDRYKIGAAWEQMEQYLAIIDKVGVTPYQSLSHIHEDWFRKETIELEG